jgi:hypothetical protein
MKIVAAPPESFDGKGTDWKKMDEQMLQVSVRYVQSLPEFKGLSDHEILKKMVEIGKRGILTKPTTPESFQTEHAMIGGNKMSKLKFLYRFNPKRLPRKLKKQQKKLEMKRIYPESPEACFVNKQGAN